MAKWKYDFLNATAYVAMIIFTLSYNYLLTSSELWLMVLTSLTLLLLMTGLMLANVLRVNVQYGVSDEVINGFIFFFGT